MQHLKNTRKQLDQCLKDTQEFNERYEDPDLWNKKVRQRQKDESRKMQHVRNDLRLMLVKRQTNREIENQAEYKRYLSKKGK